MNQIRSSRYGTCGWADTDNTTILDLFEIPVNEEDYYEAQFSVSGCIAVPQFSVSGCTAVPQFSVSGCIAVPQFSVSGCTAVPQFGVSGCTAVRVW